MSSAIDEAVQRTRLAQSNQMEMLTFRLTDNQLYGINVFKIIEIVECPRKIDRMPHAHPAVKGAVDFRGKAIAALDLSQAVDLPAKDFSDELAYLIICEYNRQLTAFIIHAPETLLTRSWTEIQRPEGMNADALVAIAYSDDNEAIMLLDIEAILAGVIGIDHEMSALSDAGNGRDWTETRILLVDDSRTALLMLQNLLGKLGCKYSSAQSAVQALELLADGGASFDLVISDIEMPGMDGFTLVRKIRDNPDLREIKVMLHSSMSNASNRIKAEQAGANDFVAKFSPDFLIERISALCSNGA